MDDFGNKLFGGLPDPQRQLAGALLMRQPNANPLILQQIEQAAMGDGQMHQNLNMRGMLGHIAQDPATTFQQDLRRGQGYGRLDETGNQVPILSQILRMLGG